MDINLLNQQHAKLASITTKLTALLDEGSLYKSLPEVKSLLGKLTDELTAHLFTEDKLLYPFLAKSDDKKIVETSKMFLDSIGNLKDSYTKYVQEWSPDKIADSPAFFIKKSLEIIYALNHRINKKEGELFPLVTNKN